MLTTSQIQKMLWNVTMNILGYDVNNPALGGKVRLSWPQDGAPAWKITDDVTFIQLNDAQNQDITIPINTVAEQANEDYQNQTSYQTRVLQAHWTIYAPNGVCLDYAYKIKRSLYNNDIIQLLRDNYIFLVPSDNSPVRMPESFNGQWWDRADYMALFNATMIDDKDIPYIKSATVQLSTDKNTNNFEVSPDTIVREDE